ncbi:unnamed protein product [Brachionus calyciflorus]|uniref:Acetyl-coenzyme A transporter 1 n=1 Tax=Brachionus calyciflorus TaxID=104777 RepID=A0A814EMG8_9BILA|nr:unnamed protein product [Brachionus calyciflorus]
MKRPGQKRVLSKEETALLEKSNLEPLDYSEDESISSSNPKQPVKQNLKKDYKNIALLMFLYFLQGIPLGLTGSLPFILTSRKVSYADQGTFSFAFWPFSLKLLWAPIVDSIYFKKFGRRKSWLIPIQYILGAFMIIFSGYIKDLLNEKPGDFQSHHDIYMITGIFFMFTFLAATQDIAVDGWALTMLSKENVSWGSTCNTVGQTAGWFVGNVLFLTIESADFSNKYIRPFLGLEEQSYGICPIDKFMYFFGLVFLVSTTLVLIFKKEEESDSEFESKKEVSLEENLTVTQTYKLMWKILWLVPVKKMILILMTVKIGFAAESMGYLKMIENGVPKEKLGLLAVPLTPLQIILPLLLSRYTNGTHPLDLYIKAIPYRLVMNLVGAAWIYFTPSFKDSNNEYPLYYFALCLLINSIQSIFTYSMFVSQMAFFAKVSDKKIGGTYMTFLNTITNMGGNWPTTTALYLANYLNAKKCSYDQLVNPSVQMNSTVLEQINKNLCSNDVESQNCVNLGGFCVTKIDAFYVETLACTLFGVVWILSFRKLMYNLQDMPKSLWKISKKALE